MPDSFRPEDHAIRKLHVATISGIVFGTFSDATPPIEDLLDRRSPPPCG